MVKNLETIKINSAVIGQKINGEVIVSAEEDKISTIGNGYKTYYSFDGNNLRQTNSVKISPTIQNMYLNSLNKLK